MDSFACHINECFFCLLKAIQSASLARVEAYSLSPKKKEETCFRSSALAIERMKKQTVS